MTGLQKSILATLAYSDIFDYPLTEKEIGKWLISEPSAKFKMQSSNLQFKVKSCLSLLCNQYIIEKHNTLYCLKKRKEIISLRRKREEYSKEKLLIAEKTAEKLSWLPWIKMIGITGSLAMNNGSTDDDIDLMIIAQNNRLWLIRFLIVALSPFLGISRRKYGETKVKNKVCLNLFLDEAGLTSETRDLFTAHEILQIKPLYNKNNTYERLLLANRWVSDYLPYAQGITVRKTKETNRNNPNVYYINILIYYINLFFYKIQHCYMRNRITNEVVSLHKAYFHPRPLADGIQNQFLTRLANLNKIAVGSVK